MGSGDIIHANKKENIDLYYGLSGSYGSLGLLTCIKVNLIKASPYVRTVYSPSGNYEQTVKKLSDEVGKKEADFIDSIVFDNQRAVIIKGYFHEPKDE